jgi:hypothetical protein
MPGQLFLLGWVDKMTAEERVSPACLTSAHVEKAAPLTSIYKKSNTIIEMLLSYPKIPLMIMNFFTNS